MNTCKINEIREIYKTSHILEIPHFLQIFNLQTNT